MFGSKNRLAAYRLGLPGGLKPEDVSTWLATLAAARYQQRFGLLHPPPVVLETVATKDGIGHYLIFSRLERSRLLATLRAALPVRLTDAPEHLARRPRLHLSAELAVSGTAELAVDRTEAANAAVLAAMQPLHSQERIIVQAVLGGGARGRASSSGRHPQLRLAWRIGVQAARHDRAGRLLGAVIDGFRLLEVPGTRLVRRRLPSWLVGRRLRRQSAPIFRSTLLSPAEAAPLLCMTPGRPLPGLHLGAARQLPPPPDMPAPSTGSVVVARSNYPGTHQPLALSLADRLMHSYICGPTGSGKSTLMVNMALSDIAAGRGLVFIDPKGDAVADILERLPASRHGDVVVLDPAAVQDNVVGWNLLAGGGGELGRELTVDHAVHVFHELWKDSWGPRTADVLRAALLTLASCRTADGQAFTLADAAPLLTDQSLRRFVLEQAAVPHSLRDFWAEYQARTPEDQAAVIGPSLNKLRAFSTRTPLRLMLGQSQGFNLEDVFTKRRILLVPLSKGTVGEETARLLGSLLVAGLWQACLRRAALPSAKRHPVMAYVDELQDVLRLPLSIEDMLAQARGLGMGLVLGNQSLQQLPGSMRSALLGVARTQIAFQLGYEDAKILSRSFAPLTAADLQGLEAREIAMRPCIGGRSAGAVTGTTLPLPVATGDGPALAAASRRRYGRARAEVEAAMRGRVQVPALAGDIGRKPKGPVL